MRRRAFDVTRRIFRRLAAFFPVSGFIPGFFMTRSVLSIPFTDMEPSCRRNISNSLYVEDNPRGDAAVAKRLPRLLGKLSVHLYAVNIPFYKIAIIPTEWRLSSEFTLVR